jgi:transposase
MARKTETTASAVAYDHDSTVVAALELSGKSWELAAVVPGVARRPRRRLEPGDIAGVLATIARWREEALRAGRTVRRVVLAYEAGRDGFWIARALGAHGIEVHVMHPASIPVERRGRRAKTDRIDLDMLLRTLLAWLRGEPRVCSMVVVPSVDEEDARRPGREREALGGERIRLENKIVNLLALHGIRGFKPRLKKAAEKLEALRDWAGAELPALQMEELRRLIRRHRLLSEQLAEIEAARQERLEAPDPDRARRMVQQLMLLNTIGIETASALGFEVLCRPFRGRRPLAGFVGITGTPFMSGGMEREQGISKNGNPRVRRLLLQLAWRWQRLQKDSALSRWFHERTAGAKGRVRKVMIVALARKLLIALWRYVNDGVVPEGARLAAA